MGNHTCMSDFTYVMRAVFPVRANGVAAMNLFTQKQYKKWLKLGRAIEKPLFYPDLAVINKIMSLVKAGGYVIVYPEGQVTAHAVTDKNIGGVAKLAKHLKCNVYTFRTENAWNVDPLWYKGGKRKGTSRSVLDICLSKEQLENLTVAETEAKIYEKLRVTDEDIINNKLEVSCDNAADGLEVYLYKCCRCFENTMKSESGWIYCTACGNSVKLTKTGRLAADDGCFSPPTIHLYNEIIIAKEKEQLKETSFAVTLKMKGGNGPMGVETVGKGEVVFSKDGVTYSGAKNGETVNLRFDKRLKYPSDISKNFQIYEKNEWYEFWCDNATDNSRAVIIGELFYQYKMSATRGDIML